MYRKIQRIGNSYYVSLPIEWIKEYKLKKGSELKIGVRENGEVYIIPLTQFKTEEKKIIIEFDEENIEKMILGYYLMGYDSIIIKSKESFKSNEREQILKIARKLSGIEITDESREFITLQNLIDDSSIDPIKIIFRMNALSSTIYVDVITELKEKKGMLKDIVARDEELDRLYFLIVRQLRSLVLKPSLLDKLGLNLIDCMDLRIAAHFIEKIGDEATNLAKFLLNKEVKLKIEAINALEKLTQRIQELQEDAIKYFIKKKNIDPIKKELIIIYDDIEIIENKFDNIDKNILEIMKNIINYNIDICDLVMYF